MMKVFFKNTPMVYLHKEKWSNDEQV